MQRRQVLKNIGLSAGLMAVTPSVVSLFQSCQSQPTINWTPQFFPKENATLITSLTDVILPKTSTPSGTEVNVHTFIDKYVLEVYDQKQQNFMKESLNAFASQVDGDLVSDVEPYLKKYLRDLGADKEKQLNSEVEAYKKDGSQSSPEALALAFIKAYRELAVWSFKITEYVGEKVLAYKPIPGEQRGCVDLQEATGGKAWSL